MELKCASTGMRLLYTSAVAFDVTNNSVINIKPLVLHKANMTKFPVSNFLQWSSAQHLGELIAYSHEKVIGEKKNLKEKNNIESISAINKISEICQT